MCVQTDVYSCIHVFLRSHSLNVHVGDLNCEGKTAGMFLSDVFNVLIE